MNMSDTILYMAGSDRLSAEDWVEASLQVLVEGGVAAVKILPIAQRLGVTRGSFY
ncbi:MAG: TetR/AcrR family transcriptional regulator, partial [Acidimicrobiaceae bacterium]|nr:TetR/AcrR family transcriptional regulator [Acidimicrobiaceae bacterium]